MNVFDSFPSTRVARASLWMLLAFAGACGASGHDASAEDAGADAARDSGHPRDARVREAGDASEPDHAAPLPDTGPHEAGVDAREDGPADASSSHANGTLGPWQSLAPMPVPRANHCSVAAAGYLVVIGGNYEPEGGSSFVNLDAVHVAKLNADGSLGAWSSAGKTPSPVNGCTAVANGDSVYLVDGIYDDASQEGTVFKATLSAKGELGAWSTVGTLPAGDDAFYSAAWIASDASETLYVMAETATNDTVTLRAATSPAFGSFSTDDWLPGFLGRPEYAFTGSFVYALGGYLSTDAGNPVVTTVTFATIGANGVVGAAFTTEPLPSAVTFGNGVAVDDWIFVIGGKTSLFGSGVVGTVSAHVGGQGQLGPWHPQTSLPAGRTDMAVTVAGDFVYLTGGGDTGPGLASVYAARIRF